MARARRKHDDYVFKGPLFMKFQYSRRKMNLNLSADFVDLNGTRVLSLEREGRQECERAASAARKGRELAVLPVQTLAIVILTEVFGLQN